jgi:AhpD family alkylhydroperoxidase
MPNDNIVSDKERALISLAASVASGCRPCTAYHVKSARAAGACERSISLAVDTALIGRTSAAHAIDEWAAECQGPRPDIDAEFRTSKELIGELMSIATAVAVNSVPDLERHVAGAQEKGANPEQIRSAIGIARQIQRTAEEKIDARTTRLEEHAPLNPSAARATACCGPDQPGGADSAVKTTTGCGCR